jgi:hypothetical protein
MLKASAIEVLDPRVWRRVAPRTFCGSRATDRALSLAFVLLLCAVCWSPRTRTGRREPTELAVRGGSQWRGCGH